MIFSIQRDLEEYFNRCGFTDPDQYAVAVAKLYDRERQRKTPNAFLSSMKKIRTVFFKANTGVQRSAFEHRVLGRLDGKFKKKASFSCRNPSPRELRHLRIAS